MLFACAVLFCASAGAWGQPLSWNGNTTGSIDVSTNGVGNVQINLTGNVTLDTLNITTNGGNSVSINLNNLTLTVDTINLKSNSGAGDYANLIVYGSGSLIVRLLRNESPSASSVSTLYGATVSITTLTSNNGTLSIGGNSSTLEISETQGNVSYGGGVKVVDPNVFYWIGSSPGTWTTSSNWSHEAGGSPLSSGYPGIGNNQTAVFNSTISVSAFEASGGISFQNDGRGIVTVTSISHGNEKITISKGIVRFNLSDANKTIGTVTVKTNAQFQPRTGSLVIDGDLIVEQSGSVYPANSFTINGGISTEGAIFGDIPKITVLGATEIKSGGSIAFSGARTNEQIYSGTFTNNGTFTGGSGTVTFNGEFTAGSGSTFTASSTNTYFLAGTDFSNMTSGFTANSGRIYFYNTNSGTTTFKTPNYGVTFNDVWFGGNVEINATKDFSVGDLRMRDDSTTYHLGDTFTAKITGGNTVTVTGELQLSRVSSTNGVVGIFELDGNLTDNGTFVMNSGSALHIATGRTLTLASFSNVSNTSYSYAVKVSGTLKTPSGASGTLTLNEMNLIVTDTGIINIGEVNVSFADDPSAVTYNTAEIAFGVTEKNCVLSNEGSITAGSFTLPANTTVNNSKIMTLSGSLTGGKSLTNGSNSSLSATSITFSDSITNEKTIISSGSSATISAASIINNGSITCMGTASTLEFGSFSGSGSVTTYGNKIVSTTGTTATMGDLTIAGTTTCQGLSGGLVIDKTLVAYYPLTLQTGDLTVNGTGGAFSIIRNNVITPSGEQIYKGNVQVSADAMLESNGSIAFSSVEIASEVSLSFGSPSSAAYAVTVSGDWTNNNATGGLTAYDSTVTFTGANATVSGSQVFHNAAFSGDGTNLSGNNTFAAATFSGNTSFGGSNTFDTFSCTEAGKTLSFATGTTQTVTGTATGALTLKGASGSLLSLNGAGQLVVAKTAFTGEYLSLDENVTITESAGNVVKGAFSVSESVGASALATYAALFNNGWKLSDVAYVWTGGTDTAWGTASNWNIGLVPGVSADNTDGVSVSIPDSVSSGRYPDAGSTSYSVGTLMVGTSTETTHDATLMLGSAGVIVTDSATGAFTNYGTIVYSDVGRITSDGSTAINDTSNDGWVEYSGTGQTITDFGAGDDYANLSVSGTATAGTDISANGDITVNGAFTTSGALSAGGDITVTGTFTATGAMSANNNVSVSSGAMLSLGTAGLTATGTLTADGTVTATGGTVSAQTLSVGTTGTLDGTTALSVTGNSTIAGAIGNTTPLASFSIGGNLQTTAPISAGSVSVTGTADLGADITTTGAQVYTGAVTANTTELKTTTDGTVSFGDTLTLSASLTVTTVNSNVDFTGAVTNASAQPLTVAAGTGAVTFSGSVGTSAIPLGTLSSTGTGAVSFGDAVQATSVDIAGATTIGTSASVTTSGTQTYAGAVTNDGTISGGNTITFNSTVTNTGTINVPSLADGTTSITFGGAYTGTNGSLVGAKTSDSDMTPNPVIAFAGDVTLGTFTANGDMVRFTGSSAQSLTTNGQQFASVVIATGASVTPSDAMAASGTLTVEANAAFTAGTGTFSVGGDVTNGGTITLVGGNTTLSAALDNSGTISGGAGTLSVGGAVTNTGTITLSTGDATFTGAYSGMNGALTASSGTTSFAANADFSTTTFTANGGTVVFSGTSDQTLTCSSATLQFANLEIASSASVKTASSFEVSGNWTNNGAFEASAGTIAFTGSNVTVSGANTFFAVKAETANAAISFTGANTFDSFTANSVSTVSFAAVNSFNSFTGTSLGALSFSDDNTFVTLSLTGAGTTVNFGAGKTQTVTGTFSSSGTSSGTILLTTDAASPSKDTESTWWTLSMPNYDGSAITASFPTFENTKIAFSKSSQDIIHAWAASVDEDVEDSTSNWFSTEYYWIGGNASGGSDWKVNANWKHKDSSGNYYDVRKWPTFDKNRNTIFVATASGNKNLVLGEPVKMKKLTVSSGAEIDLKGFAVNADDGDATTKDFVNNGTVRLYGTSGQIASSVENGTDSTIEYYIEASGSSSLVWGNSYENLTILSPFAMAEDVSVAKNLTLGKDSSYGASGMISNKFTVTGTTSISNGSGNALGLSGANSFGGKVTLTDAGNVTLSGANAFTGGCDIVSGGAIVLNSDGSLSLGTVSCDSLEVQSSVTFTADVSSPVTFTGTGATIAGGGVTFNPAVFFDGSGATLTGDNTFASSATFSGAGTTLTGNNTFTSATFSAATTLSADNTFGTATFSADTTFNGSNTFGTMTCASAGGKTLTFAAGTTQTITGIPSASLIPLELKGTSASSRLAISGAGKIIVLKNTASATYFAGEYLSVGSGVQIVASSVAVSPEYGAYSISESVPSDGISPTQYAAVYKNGWNLGYDFEYTWTGETSDSWDEESNWNIGIVPGLTGKNTLGAKVKIPDEKTNYPTVNVGGISVESLEIGDSSGTHNASIKLTSNPLSVTGSSSGTAFLTNYGTIEYTGSARITDGTNPLNDAANGGTVLYSGGTASSPLTLTDFSATGSDYANLKITGIVTDSSPVVVSGKTLIKIANDASITLSQAHTFTGPVTIESGDSVSLTGGNTFTGGVVISGSDSSVTLNSASDYSLGAGTGSDALTCKNLTLSGGSSVTVQNALMVTNTLTNENTVSLTTDGTALSFGTYIGASGGTDKVVLGANTLTATGTGSTISTVQTSGNSMLTNNGTGLVTIGTYKNTGATSLAVNGGTTGITLSSAEYGGTSLTANGTVTLAASSAVNLLGAVTVESGATKMAGGLSCAALTLSGGTATFGGDSTAASVSIASDAALIAGENATDAYTLTVSGDWTNNAGGTGFVPQAGTVEFTGNNVTVSGANTFYAVKAETADATISFTGANTFNLFSATGANTAATFAGVNTFGTFSATGANSAVTFADDNTFGAISLTGAGTTVKFGAGKTQTVMGTFSSSGTSSDPILLTTDAASPSKANESTWWTLSMPNYDGSAVAASFPTFLHTKVSYSKADENHRIAHDWGATVAEGVSDSTANWFLTTFYWLGSANSSWATTENWRYSETATETVAMAPSFTNGRNKIIIATAADGNNLILSDDISIKSLTVNAGKTLDLAAHAVTANDSDNSTADFENNGTVRMTGTQTINASMQNGTGSTIEYYGGNLSSLPWDGDATTEGKQYEKLTFASGAGGSAGDSLEISGELTLSSDAGNMTLSGANTYGGQVNVSDGNLTLSADATMPTLTVAAGAGFLAGAKLTVNGAVSNGGTITLSTGDATFTGAYSGTNGTFTASSGTTTFAAAADFSSTTFTANGGTVIFSGANAGIRGNTTTGTTFATVQFTGNGATLNGNNTFTAATFSGAGTTLAGNNSFGTTTFSADTTFNGNNTFGTLSCASAGGKTLTFAAGTTQTVTGTATGALTLSGTNDSTLLTLATTGSGSAAIIVPTGALSAKWLSIGKELTIRDGATVTEGAFTAANSEPSTTGTPAQADYVVVYKNGWNLGYAFAYVWTGADGTDGTAWANESNWNIGIVPGSANTQNAVVSIPDGVSSGKYPDTGNNAYTVESLTIGTNGAGTHDATLKVTGTGALTVGDMLSNNGMLTLTDSAAVTTDALSNNGTLTLTNASALTTSTLANDGTITHASASAFKANTAFTNSGTIIYQNSGRITNGSGTPVNDAEHNGLVKYDGTGLTVTDFGDTDYANLSVSGTATASTDISANGDITVTGALTATGAMSASNNVSVSSGATLALGTAGLSAIGTLTADGTVTATGGTVSARTLFVGATGTLDGATALSVTGGAVVAGVIGGTTPLASFSTGGILQTTAAVSAGSVSVTGTADLGADITTTGAQTYTGAVTITADAALASSAAGTISFESTVTNTHTLTIDTADAVRFAAAYTGTDGTLVMTGSGTISFPVASSFGTFSATGADTTATFNGVNTFGTFSSSGTGAILTFADTNTFTSFSSAGANSAVTFADDNTFDTLSITGEGTTAKFGAGKTQKVTGTFASTGAAGSPVTLTTTATTPSGEADWWILDIPSAASMTNFTHTKVEYTKSVHDIAHAWDASVEEVAGTTTNWFWHIFYWLGATDANWGTLSNWSYTADGTTAASRIPSASDGYDSVIINTANSGNTLTLTDAITVHAVTVNAGKTLDLAAHAVTANDSDNSTADFENNGTVRMTGTQTINASMKNGAESTIEYYGGNLSSLPWDGDATTEGKQYENLMFTNGAGGSVADSLAISGELTLSGGAGNMTLTGANTYGGQVNVSDGNLTVSADATMPTLTVAAGAGFSAGAKLTVNGAVSNGGTITLSGDDTVLSGALTNSGAFNGGAGTLSVGGAVTNAGTITLSTGDVTFTGAYSGTNGAFTASSGTTTFAADADFSTTTFTANDGTVIFSGANAVVSGNTTSGTTFSTAQFTGDGCTLNGNNSFGTATFSGNGTTLSGNNVFGTATFSASATLSGSNTFGTFTATTAGTTYTFGAGTTQKVTDAFVVQGAEENLIVLKSSVPGTVWTIDVPVAKTTVSYVNVSDSVSVYASIEAALSVDGGNTTNWDFMEGLPLPSLTMMLSPVGEDKVYAIFSRKVVYKDKSLGELSASEREEALSYIPDNFIFITAGGNPIADPSCVLHEWKVKNAEYVAEGTNYTVLILHINHQVTLEDLKRMGVYITLLHKSDTKHAHALSDFALNVVQPVYALAEGTSEKHTVRDFTANSGDRIHAESDIILQARVVSGNKDSRGNDMAPLSGEVPVLVPDVKSEIKSTWKSDVINALLNVDWRVWITDALPALSSDYNDSPQKAVSGEMAGDAAKMLYNFTLKNAANRPASERYGWASGDEVQFIFKLQDKSGNDITIDMYGDGTKIIPLYALAMVNGVSRALPSVDLWSLKLESAKKQRGGVTILNNVIDVGIREETVLQVDMPSDGDLSVYVMTLDGNIVRQLEHGRVAAGTHYYRWNGTNNAGNAVARGLYFVRIIGSGIDETRKVMCVKE
ncbi:MAG: hypothetical protein IJS09_03180 [Treponema sp.]|nr:hypothetical protein [Treponema sp.]